MNKEKAPSEDREPLTIETLEQVTGGSGNAESGQQAIFPIILNVPVYCKRCGNEYEPTTADEVDMGLCPDCR